MVLRQYILVRKDLPVEAQMVAVAHAAGESILTCIQSDKTSCILLHVENELELLQWAQILEVRPYSYILHREPDAPYDNQAMSIGLTPTSDTPDLRALFRQEKLVKVS